MTGLARFEGEQHLPVVDFELLGQLLRIHGGKRLEQHQRRPRHVERVLLPGVVHVLLEGAALGAADGAHRAEVDEGQSPALAEDDAVWVRIGAEEEMLVPAPVVDPRQTARDLPRVDAEPARQAQDLLVLLFDRGHQLPEPHAGDELLDDDVLTGELEEHARSGEEALARIAGRPAEQVRVTRFTDEVQFLHQGLAQLAPHALRVAGPQHREELQRAGQPVERLQVRHEQLAGPGPPHLHDDSRAGPQDGLVGARDGGRPDRVRVEPGKGLFERPAGDSLDHGDRAIGRKRRDAVEHAGKLVAVFPGQQIEAHGELLADLDEGPAGALEDPPQVRGPARGSARAPEPVPERRRAEPEENAEPDEQPEECPDAARVELDRLHLGRSSLYGPQGEQGAAGERCDDPRLSLAHDADSWVRRRSRRHDPGTPLGSIAIKRLRYRHGCTSRESLPATRKTPAGRVRPPR